MLSQSVAEEDDYSSGITISESLGRLNIILTNSAIYDDAYLELLFENYTWTQPASSSVYYFSLGQNLSVYALYELIREAESNVPIAVELIRDQYIIIQTNLPGLSYALITETFWYSPSSRSYSEYAFMAMQGSFIEDAIIYRDEALITGKVIYIPYHLFDDHSLFWSEDLNTPLCTGTGNEFGHFIGQYFRIYGDKADFSAFYASLDLYEITETENQLILDGPIFRSIQATGRPGQQQGRIILTFREENERQYVAYSFELE